MVSSCIDYIQYNSENSGKCGTWKFPRGITSACPNGFFTIISTVCYKYEWVILKIFMDVLEKSHLYKFMYSSYAFYFSLS